MGRRHQAPSAPRPRWQGDRDWVVEEETAYAISVNRVTASIARAVLPIFPHGRCIHCLAAERGIMEHDARAAALVLIARDHFAVVSRTCH
jgi:hypothetical protein